MAQDLSREEILTRVVCSLIQSNYLTDQVANNTLVDVADDITGKIVDKIASYVTEEDSKYIDDVLAGKYNQIFEEETDNSIHGDEIDDDEMPPQYQRPRRLK